MATVTVICDPEYRARTELRSILGNEPAKLKAALNEVTAALQGTTSYEPGGDLESALFGLMYLNIFEGRQRDVVPELRRSQANSH